MVKGKLALLLGQADENYQSEFIRGVMSRGFELGYDVCVFSMYIKYQNNKDRETGDSNIYNLINYDMFDGVIILSDTIQTPGVKDQIEEKISQVYNGPVVCVDTDSKFFYSFWTDGYDLVYKLMEHVIKHHGMKDIAFLTGRKTHKHSQRRLEAYKNALTDNGIDIREDRIFYGDFWYTSGNSTAEILLRDREDFPEAIVCANDCMAIGFAEEMERRGLTVPKDIAVLGYGTSEEGQLCPRPLTSTYVPASDYGIYSVDTIMRLKDSLEPEKPTYETRLFIGESCGCESETPDKNLDRRLSWQSNNSEEGYYSIHNYMMDDLSGSDNLGELLSSIFENIFQLRGVQRFNICLNDLWLNPGKMISTEFQEKGYSDMMVNAISYNASKMSESVIGTEKVFEKDDLLPEFDKERPHGYIFTPIYIESKSFGYAMVSYGDRPSSYDEVYRLWIRDVARGFESLRRLMIMREFEKRRMEFINSKVVLGPEDKELSEVEKILDNNLLTYHFQPIVNAADGEIYSYEALMRSASEWKIPPIQIIKHADALNRISDVERATFVNVLEIVDQNTELFEGKKVFINSIPGSKLEYNDFVAVEKMLKKYNNIAVVELTEQAEMSDKDLEELKDQFRRYGIGIAVDDYGTGYSNITNLLRYMPEYVKIDRALLTEIQTSAQKQHFVREVIEFCHANNIMALAEGVETSEELRTVIKLGADLIQGYYIARPSARIVQAVDTNVRMEISRYHREREDGTSDRSYIAGRVGRVSISNLIKEDTTTIVIGEKDVTFRDITIVGTPGIRSDIHIEVLEGFDGRITLENVSLSNIKNRPCIRMAENSNVTLSLVGENFLQGGGIKVPEGSSLTIEGDGNLKIILSASENYGIGNTIDSRHGLIEFYQDGEVHIESNGKTCVGIGSGEGGEIKIHKGKYIILVNGDEGVGIGSLKGNDSIIIHDVDMRLDATLYKGVCIGNVEGPADIDMWRSLVKCHGSGKTMTMIGTIDGDNAKVYIHDMSLNLNLRADYSTGLGSYAGHTDFTIDASSLRYNGMGRSALVYGGCTEDSDIVVDHSHVIVDIVCDKRKITNAPTDRIKTVLSRYDLTINGEKA
ncbi:MAG: EAL domain-containing protein [Eubacterium sp.]|nr:EAL domain-containing protein [Eubacterium sp.]